MAITFKLTFGDSNEENKFEENKNSNYITSNTKYVKETHDKTVFSCHGNECVYSKSAQYHHEDSSVKGGWVGDVFHIDWAI